jgi:hypothetical protein
MMLSFPSPEFDDAVAAVCHGSATEIEMRALNRLLRNNPSARDEYLLRVELHTRLASDPDLFSQPAKAAAECRISASALAGRRHILTARPPAPTTTMRFARALALAACLALLGAGAWSLWLSQLFNRNAPGTHAVAMLTSIVDARWGRATGPLRIGSPLGPGWLKLESGLAQIVFYSGARVVIEGPAELQLVSPTEAACLTGRLLAEVPPGARGFRLQTGQLTVVDLGTTFGIDATAARTEVHVFTGQVELFSGTELKQVLRDDQAAIAQELAPLQFMSADPEAFAFLFEFQQRSLASGAFRYEHWQFTSAKLNQDPSLVVRFDFQDFGGADWTLFNAAQGNRSVREATVVGCLRGEGRWREKQSLEFQTVNDRVLLSVPGQFDSLTLAAWVRVKGLDRRLNSLFMCHGFEPGTVHWLIRNDGALGLTVFGPGSGNFQILASPPVLTLEQFGMWLHLAAVLNGHARQVVHYVDGVPVASEALKLPPPYQLGSAELGNWNPLSSSKPAPVMVRNFSGSFDEFTLFSRALTDAEVHELYFQGKPNL